MSELDGGLRPGSRRRGLGMGLATLLGSTGEAALEAGEAPRVVPIEALRPSRLQPRRHFPEDDLEALAQSIRARGVMQPLLVRPARDEGALFEIVAGERRWRAAQRAGLHELPVMIRQLADADALEVALIENVQRQDLSPLEEAEGYRQLIEEFEHTQEALASALGRSRSHIANALRLLGLPPPVRALLEGGQLSAGHARALLGAAEPAALAEQVVRRGLNVRQTEALVRIAGQRPARPRRDLDPNTRTLEHDLSHRLGLPVSLKPGKGSSGVLTITYRSHEQLDELIRRFTS